MNTVRIILQPNAERNAQLYLTLVDFEKAFDAVDRNMLWNVLETCGIQGRVLNVVKEFYKVSALSVVHSGKKPSPAFSVRVKQGCILAPTVFVVLMDFIMRITLQNKNRCVRWDLQDRFADLDLTSRMTFASHRHLLKIRTIKLMSLWMWPVNFLLRLMLVK
jgi:DUF438 domain-containing protein